VRLALSSQSIMARATELIRHARSVFVVVGFWRRYFANAPIGDHTFPRKENVVALCFVRVGISPFLIPFACSFLSLHTKIAAI
jgi:hypothetical protein